MANTLKNAKNWSLNKLDSSRRTELFAKNIKQIS